MVSINQTIIFKRYLRITYRTEDSQGVLLWLKLTGLGRSYCMTEPAQLNDISYTPLVQAPTSKKMCETIISRYYEWEIQIQYSEDEATNNNNNNLFNSHEAENHEQKYIHRNINQ